MSFYSYWEGTIKFKDDKSFKEALEAMDPWIDQNYLEDEKVLKGRFLEFPAMFQVGDVGRNIHRGINILCDIGFSGKLVGTSTDGCFEGYVINDGVEEAGVDLFEWGKKELNIDLESIDIDENWDEYSELENEICNCFYERNM